MEVGGVHHDGLICSVCSSESINHLSFGAVFDRNFPHCFACSHRELLLGLDNQRALDI